MAVDEKLVGALMRPLAISAREPISQDPRSPCCRVRRRLSRLEPTHTNLPVLALSAARWRRLPAGLLPFQHNKLLIRLDISGRSLTAGYRASCAAISSIGKAINSNGDHGLEIVTLAPYH